MRAAEQQVFLEGFEPPLASPIAKRGPRASTDLNGEHGFFLALQLEAHVKQEFARRAAGIKSQYRLHGNLRPRRNLHVTLFSLGRYEGPDENADRAIGRALLTASAFRHATFVVRMDRVLRFGRGDGVNAVVAAGGEDGAGVEALLTFRERLRLALALDGLLFDSDFTPHVTLLYGINPPLELKMVPVVWTVRDFSLVHSDIGKSRHTALGTWPLIDWN